MMMMMMRVSHPKTVLLIGSLLLCLLPVAAQSATPQNDTPQSDTPLIPRRVLFSDADKAGVRLSPDGKWVSYLAPLDGVFNLWAVAVAPPAKAVALTRLTQDPVLNYQWTYDSRRLVYLRRVAAGVHLFVLDLQGGESRDLTPQAGGTVRLERLSLEFPQEVLVSLNDRDPQRYDLWRINLQTGERRRVLENGGYDSFFCDDRLEPRVARRNTADGGYELYKLNERGDWARFDRLSYEEARVTQPLTLDKSGKVLYLIDNRHTDTGVLKAVNLQTGRSRVLVSDRLADLSPGLMLHPQTSAVRSATAAYARTRRHLLERAMAGDFRYLATVHSGDVGIAGQSLDDRNWLVVYQDGGPLRYYLYDRRRRRAAFLFTDNRAIEGYALARRQAALVKTRDELQLPCDLYLPAWAQAAGGKGLKERLPLLVYVHGGPSVAYPWNSWLTNRVLQLLANRGYAVLRVEFRGADGFGKQILQAGAQEWGGKMHEDVLDAVEWAQRQNLAIRGRVGILGWSYGGYETLIALMQTPERFACGIAMYPVTDLVEMMQTRTPPYFRDFWRRQVGDESTANGRALLRARSPLYQAERLNRPLLITHGGRDRAVGHAHSDRLVQALKGLQKPVTYLYYPEEEHDYRQPESWLSLFAVAERFLHEHLGGRYEPVGDDLSSGGFRILEGRELIPGLEGVRQAAR